VALDAKSKTEVTRLVGHDTDILVVSAQGIQSVTQSCVTKLRAVISEGTAYEQLTQLTLDLEPWPEAADAKAQAGAGAGKR